MYIKLPLTRKQANEQMNNLIICVCVCTVAGCCCCWFVIVEMCCVFVSFGNGSAVRACERVYSCVFVWLVLIPFWYNRNMFKIFTVSRVQDLVEFCHVFRKKLLETKNKNKLIFIHKTTSLSNNIDIITS